MTELLIGADNIAKAFKLKRRQVYNLREKGKAPIRNVEGLGLVAERQKLERFLIGEHQENPL